MRTRLELAAQTHRGMVRERNEDSFLVVDLATGARSGPKPVRAELESTSGFALAVLNASGGFPWGQPGAELAVDALRAVLVGAPLPSSLVGAMRAASRAIVDEVARDRRREGLSVVATLGVVSEDRLHLIHVGDTRAYLLRCGRIVQLTHDDSTINDAAKLGYRQDQCFPGVVTRALGYRATVDSAVVSTFKLCAGDVVLLCSRGLHALVDVAAIERAIVASADLASASDVLHQLATSAGAPHNVTTLVARPTSDVLRAPAPEEMLARPTAPPARVR